MKQKNQEHANENASSKGKDDLSHASMIEKRNN